MNGTQRLAGWAVAAGLIARLARLGPPRPTGAAERVRALPAAGLPVRAPVAVHWDEHLVPWIEAEHDDDLAVALGAVQAHLRLAQMEAMRRLARGRVAELVGPLGVELDRSLRLMGFGRAVPGIRAMLPEATRRWAEGFVAGVNHHLAHAPALPYELDWLGLRPEPWTLDDLLLVGRLAAADVSWMVFARLLRAREGLPASGWDALWPRMLDGDAATLPAGAEAAALGLGLARGSNSAAVAARRSATGAAMIASDPHLGITLPAMWLLAGMRSPGVHAVGVMLPGLPVLALGRNPWIAWGGTSLHAASSELVDVSAEPMTERTEVIRVRGAAPVPLRLRETRFGPVVSDGPLLRAGRPLSLRWVGHRPSDEMSALLGVMRARDFEGFRAALSGFAVPGQTMVAAEAGPGGRVGRVIAAHLPRRNGTPAGLVSAPGEAWGLDDVAAGAAWPAEAGDGVAISANDRPGPTPVPVGFFFSPPDRAARLRALLGGPAPVTFEAMQALQRDTMHPGALALRDALLRRLPAPGPRQREAHAALAAWDGSYAAASRGALVFEAVLAHLARRLIRPEMRAPLTAIWTGRALIGRELAQAPPEALRRALRAAARALRRWGCWGGAHRLRLAHPLAAVPGLGRRFVAAGFGADGGNDTLNKTGHDLAVGRHRVTYGACARHVSDLSDSDRNLFALLGGQDGWLGSACAADQVGMWRAGRYVAVPLRPEAARAWPHRTVLRP